MHNSPETEAIRQRMEEVRGDLDTGFQGMVEDARDIGDWTYYVKTYPWAVLGVALAAGYLIAPRLGFGVQPENRASEGASGVNGSDAPPTLPPKGDTTNRALAFVGNLVMRGVSAYVIQRVDQHFASRLEKAAGAGRNDHP